MSKKQKKTGFPTIIFRIILISLLLTGTMTTVIGIDRIENYYEPYIFGIVFGGPGLALGILIALKSKPYINENNDYINLFLSILIFLFGIFLFTGSLINEKVSKIENSDHYVVTNKYRQKSGYRTPEINSLIIDVNGFPHRLICSYSYWKKINTGQTINLNFYTSKLGFDYMKLPDEK